MYILLTDILSCPRCGPGFGLILLADRIESRRVLDGTLGCANCRTKYPIRDGVADLRSVECMDAQAGCSAPPPTTATEAAASRESGHGAAGGAGDSAAGRRDADAAFRWAALMGVTEGPGFLLVAGPATEVAGEIARLIEHIEVIALMEAPESVSPLPGVSRIVVDRRLPFYSARLHGAALVGESAGALLEEAARVVGALGRIVLEPAPPDAETRVARAGMRVLARQDDTLVAARA